MKTEPCDCWAKMTAGLKEKGFQIHDGCMQLVMGENTMFVRRVLPLQTLEGKKPKRGAPSSLIMTHCPFCGQGYPTEEAKDVVPQLEAGTHHSESDEHCTAAERACRVCGCTEEDCTGCIERTGVACHWVEVDLCSACGTGDEQAGVPASLEEGKAVPFAGPECPRRCSLCCDHEEPYQTEHHWMLDYGSEEEGTFKEEGFLICRHCPATRDIPLDDEEFMEAFNL